MLLSYTSTDRQDLPADPLQPLRRIVYFAYIISDYSKTVFLFTFPDDAPESCHCSRHKARWQLFRGASQTFGYMVPEQEITEPIKDYFVYRDDLRPIFRPFPDAVKSKLRAVPMEKATI